MIKQIFNSATGSPSLSPIDMSGDNGTLMTAQVTGTNGQSVLIQGSNFGTSGPWETITADLVVGTKNSEVFYSSWRFVRVDLTGGASCAISVGGA